MTLKRVLNDLVKAVLDEAEKNENFAARLNHILSQPREPSKNNSTSNAAAHEGKGSTILKAITDEDGKTRRPSNRRSPAVLDPVQIARNNPELLRESLSTLTLEQLYDVVAEYGMDTGKLVMKWKDSARVIDRIIEVSVTRAHKGDAFRPSTNNTEGSITAEGGASDRDSQGT